MTIPDNYSRFELHDAEQAEYERYLPECDLCGCKCSGDYAYEIDGEGILCEDCFEDWANDRRVDLEDYVEQEKQKRMEW